MSIFLVVNVLDVFYHTRNAETVKANDDVSGDSVLRSTGQEGKYEVKLADGVKDIVVTVAQEGYCTITQKLQLTTSPIPALAYTGDQELWVRNLGGSGRGSSGQDADPTVPGQVTSDFNVELCVVLGQLTDVKAQVNGVASGANPVINLTATNVNVMAFEASVLDPTGTGWNIFKHTVVNVAPPKGTVLYAKRIGSPSLIALFVPEGQVVQPSVDRWDASARPLNFHLFFCPSTDNAANRSTSYPFDSYYIGLISRYFFVFRYLGKNMVNQQAQSGATPILIFPVPNRTDWHEPISSQGSILELLFEVRYFVSRKLGVPYPNQPVGKCALSGFSTSGQYVNKALVRTSDYFHYMVLQEVYGFDLGGVSAGTFAHNLKAWYNQTTDKAFRIYTAKESWWESLKSIDPAASTNSGQNGAMESQSSRASVVLVPYFYFWVKLNSETNQPAEMEDTQPPTYQVFRKGNQDDVHQLFPSIFIEHALSLSHFPTKVS